MKWGVAKTLCVVAAVASACVLIVAVLVTRSGPERSSSPTPVPASAYTDIELSSRTELDAPFQAHAVRLSSPEPDAETGANNPIAPMTTASAGKQVGTADFFSKYERMSTAALLQARDELFQRRDAEIQRVGSDLLAAGIFADESVEHIKDLETRTEPKVGPVGSRVLRYRQDSPSGTGAKVHVAEIREIDYPHVFALIDEAHWLTLEHWRHTKGNAGD